MEILQKYLNQSDNIDPESKKEHELNTSDRMILINKKTDEKFLVETYENLIRTKKFIKIENIKNVDINDYVFDDVEFSHDHYLNNDKGLFYKLDKSSTKIGSLLLKSTLWAGYAPPWPVEPKQTVISTVSGLGGAM